MGSMPRFGLMWTSANYSVVYDEDGIHLTCSPVTAMTAWGVVSAWYRIVKGERLCCSLQEPRPYSSWHLA